MSYLFADKRKKGSDPWWQLVGGIDGFNEVREKNVSSGFVITLDESMSAFKPQTTKTGNLPHLSFIQRKPEPLGTEYKNSAETSTLDVFLYTELQRGKQEMKNAEFAQQLKATTACTKRLVKYSKRELTDSEKNQSTKPPFIFLETLGLQELKQQRLSERKMRILLASSRHPMQDTQSVGWRTQ